MTARGSTLSFRRSSYLHVGIKLFAVLTSCSTPATVELYGSDISSTSTFFSLLMGRFGFEKLGIFTDVRLVSTRWSGMEEVEVADEVTEFVVLAELRAESRELLEK